MVQLERYVTVDGNNVRRRAQCPVITNEKDPELACKVYEEFSDICTDGRLHLNSGPLKFEFFHQWWQDKHALIGMPLFILLVVAMTLNQWKYATQEDRPGNLLLRDGTVVRRCEPCEANEALGMMARPDGLMDSQYIHLRNSINNWCDAVRSNRVRRDEACVGLRNTKTLGVVKNGFRRKNRGKNRKRVTFVLANQNEAKWLLIDNPFQKKSQTWKRRIVPRGFACSLGFSMSDFLSGGIFGSESLADRWMKVLQSGTEYL
jgi:hypothetical protein